MKIFCYLLLLMTPCLCLELKCEPIKVDVCSRLGYKSTGMPNIMGHQTQGSAQAGLETFFPLIKYNCSPDLLFFLCSVHAPMCVALPPTPTSVLPQNQLIGPCRPMCSRVKQLCYPVLQEFNIPWPEALDCGRFPPENNLEHMCMDGGNSSKQLPTLNPRDALNSLQANPDLIQRVKEFSKGKPELTKFDPYLKMLLETSMHNMKPAQGFSGSCAGLSFPLNHHYLNRTEQCIPKCGTDVLFAKEDKKFAEIWLAVWSILCFLTTLFTLGTYILDTNRFKYPEKCIVFLNLSYNILSTGYLLRLMVGVSGVSCTSIQGEPSLVVRQGLSPTPACTIIFILVYFSSLSAAVWWTITTATWTIVVFSSLDVKLLEVKSPLFHLIGWGIPAALTISSLVLHQVEGDELTGVCLPGQQTEDTLLHQLIIPYSILLGLACLLFVCGMVGSILRPSEMSSKMLARIGIFSIFYTLPQICVVGSLIYEWLERPSWRTDPSKHPVIEVFMMRISMWLVVGIISGSWVWSTRTIRVWKGLLGQCTGVWSKQKKPSTPIFPKVAYKSAPTEMGENKQNIMTLDNLATLRRGQSAQQYQQHTELQQQQVQLLQQHTELPSGLRNERVFL